MIESGIIHPRGHCIINEKERERIRVDKDHAVHDKEPMALFFPVLLSLST